MTADPHHLCVGATSKALFCELCGKVLDPAGLRSVKLQGFTGPASLVPSMERFWESGLLPHEPDHLADVA